MHGVNHPRTQVFDTLSELLLNHHFDFRGIFVKSYIDTLADNIFPVYPEIARDLSVLGGGYTWKINGKIIQGIEAFTRWSYEQYLAQGIGPGDLKILSAPDNFDSVLQSYRNAGEL